MQIKTIIRYHLTQIRMALINKSTKNKCCRGCGERVPSFTVYGNINWYNHYGKEYGDNLRNLYIELPYDSAIPLFGIYPDKTFLEKDTCTRMFIAALFTIAKT